MSLVPSLLQAIVRVDGEALVMHVGEKPYVVSPHGQIDLATRGLTFEAVTGLVAQLLPPDAMRSLEEVGATQFEMPTFAEFPGEHFTVTAARGGDDVWAEIRRHPAHEQDIVPPDLFAAFSGPEMQAPAADALALPREAQLWPKAPSPYPPAQVPAAVDDDPVVVSETNPAVASTPVAEPVVEEHVPLPVEVVAADAPGLPPVVADAQGPVMGVTEPNEPSVSSAPVEFPSEIAVASEPVAEPPATVGEPAPPAAASEPLPVASAPPSPVDEPHDSRKKLASWLAAFSAGQMLGRTDPTVAHERAAGELASVPSAQPVTSPVAAATLADGAVNPAATVEPVVAEQSQAVHPAPIETPETGLEFAAGTIAEPAVPVTEAVVPIVGQRPEETADLSEALIEPVAAVVEAVAAPVDSSIPILDLARSDTPAEPAVSVIRYDTEPESAPVFVIASAPPSVEARAADRESEADMSTQSPDFNPFTSAASVAVPAAEPAAGSRSASFVPFPSLVDQPQAAVVLPLARAGRDLGPGDQGAAPLERLLRLASSRGASAMYLSAGGRPSVRLDGDVQTLDTASVLSGPEVEALLLGAAPGDAIDAIRAGAGEWVWDLADVGSVRCTTFRDHHGAGAVFRIVSVRAQSASQLGLSREIQALAAESEGLVLVSGPRASGKSTLISSFVDLIGRTRRDYVITIESEVNVVHERQGAFISQREVRGGSDAALAMARAALREDPDVLVIDDLRTAGLMSVALDAAANGQLVIGGVPAHHASGAVERLIDLYQPDQRRQVQLAMAQNLRGVVSQVLLRKSGGGRVAAREVLLNTPIVASLLAEGRTAQLPVAIEGGRKSGMVPLNDALVGFVQSGAVDVREAYRRAVDRHGLLDLLKRQGIDTSFAERLA